MASAVHTRGVGAPRPLVSLTETLAIAVQHSDTEFSDVELEGAELPPPGVSRATV